MILCMKKRYCELTHYLLNTDWLCVNVPICSSRSEAVSLGNMLLEFHFISAVTPGFFLPSCSLCSFIANSTPFLDVSFFADEDIQFEFSQAISFSPSGKVALNMRKVVSKKYFHGKALSDGSTRNGSRLAAGPNSSLRAPTTCPIELASELLETITRSVCLLFFFFVPLTNTTTRLGSCTVYQVWLSMKFGLVCSQISVISPNLRFKPPRLPSLIEILTLLHPHSNVRFSASQLAISKLLVFLNSKLMKTKRRFG